ncbi:hypothetical protein ACA910_010364 [Epithemia clementina (nom. ined.)]
MSNPTPTTTTTTLAESSSSSSSFTEELRAAAGEKWDAIVHHKFTDELAAGTMDRAVLRRYLIQDFRFLDAFCILLASVIVHAPSLEDRIPACQFLGLVTSDENTYFTRCFDQLSATTETERQAIPNAPCTTAFCTLMKEAAHSGILAEMLSVLVVCEWSYLEWATRVLPQTNRDNFMTYEWVDLHSGPDFEEVVSYLRRLLDREGRTASPAVRERCQQRFLQAVQLELDFFDMAYYQRDESDADKN